ncbi:MAG: HPF/RaiA family ribosome-associated protein [Planctomycetota bacterium]|jgi:ribosomal subunit interface protein
MQIPVQVTFRDMPVSDALEMACWEEAAKLERYFDRITSCRVTVAAPHRSQTQGNQFEIRVDLTLPGGEVVVSREPPAHQTDEDPYVAVREAFDTTRRRLEDYVRRRRGDVKVHEPTPMGRVTKLFPQEDYGFLETTDGREIYFHRNSVRKSAFDRLRVGSEVQFVETETEQGPKASSLTLVHAAANA